MLLSWLTERRRRHLLENPFPAEWRAILERNVAACARLTDAEHERLCDLAQVFVAEKHWEGCGGLTMTDEVRVTVAAQACLLLLGRDHSLFAEVDSILVYPTAVMLPPRSLGVFEAPGRVVGGPRPVLGVSHRRGPVVLAWDQVLSGGRSPDDGKNLVLHEFAHKIDVLDGAADGTPALATRAGRRTWAEVCSRVFLTMREHLDRGEPTFLDPYAAENEAEFFAVATETFFERSRDLRRELPDLYRLLAGFYNQDPAARAA